MSLLLPILATAGILSGLTSVFTKKEKKSLRRILFVVGAFVAILLIWCQFFFQVRESAEAEKWHQDELEQAEKHHQVELAQAEQKNKEISGQLSQILEKYTTIHPYLSDKEAIKFLLADLEGQIKWSDRQQRASMLGITLPGRSSQVPISVLSEFLTHEDSSVRSFAAFYLNRIGTPEATDALKNVEQDSQK